MEPKLREYIENLFVSAPQSRQSYELREEIIRNTIERYHDLLSEGKSEGEAYNLAIAGIGDINELIEALGGEPIEETVYSDEQLAVVKNRKTIFTTIAVALYILCVTPCIFFDAIGIESMGVATMFLMVSTATALLVFSHMTRYLPVMSDEREIESLKKKAYLRAAAIGMYISCPVPAIIFDDSGFSSISPIFVILIIAAATVMIIFSRRDRIYKRADDTMVESFKEWSSTKQEMSLLYKILVAILWVTVSTIYIIITLHGIFYYSIAVGSVSWIIFLVAVALQNLMKAIFDYVEVTKCENQQETE